MQHLIRLHICLLLFSTGLFRAAGQGHLRFERYSIDEGLPGLKNDMIMQDHQGFLWIATNAGLARFDGRYFRVYKHNPADSTSLSHDYIYMIFEDSRRTLWVGTSEGLNKFDRNTNSFKRYLHQPGVKNSLVAQAPGYFLEDGQGNLWIATYGGLSKFNPLKEEFTNFYHDPNDPNTISHNNVNWMWLGAGNKLWVATIEGLDCMDIEAGQLLKFKHDPNDASSLATNLITTVFEDSRGRVWAGAYPLGASMMTGLSGKWTHYLHDPAKPNSLSNGTVYMVNEDAAGNIWFSTFGGGLSMLDARAERFTHYRHDPADDKSLMGDIATASFWDREGNLWVDSRDVGVNMANAFADRFTHHGFDKRFNAGVVRAFDKDREGNLWIATDKGLFRRDARSDALAHYKHDPTDKSTLYHNDVNDVHVDALGTVWIVMRYGGLSRLDPRTNRITRVLPDPGNPFSTEFLQCMYEDSKGNFWIGSVRDGLLRMDGETGNWSGFKHNPDDANSLSDNLIICIIEDGKGNIWAGTQNGGLNMLDPNTGPFRRFQHDPNDTASISHNHIRRLFLDSKGAIWAATFAGGLDRYDERTGKFRRLLQKEITRQVYGIVEDRLGNLWLSTYGQGVVKYNPATGAINYFGIEDGLKSSAFSFGAVHYCHRSGTVYFGDNKGYVAFHPDSIFINSYIPPVFITNLQYYRKNRQTGELELVTEDIAYRDVVKLTYREKILMFQFAALSYSKPLKNQYAYQLEGFDEQWIQLGTRNEATFTNLQPGKYTLRVKGSNGDGVWNDVPAVLDIVILPPWYWAWWSKPLYALALIAVAFLFFRFQLGRRLAKAEALRLRELDGFKTRFYTNITHEFRTPLTVILGMADRIEESPRHWLHKGLRMIRSNSKNLLRLVNQMLDLSKLDAGSLPLNVVQSDIITWLRTLVELSQSQALLKDIRLSFEPQQEHCMMDFDPDKIRDITGNLLSNAIKFTPEGGRVTLYAGAAAGSFHIRVEDTGPGIAPEQLPHIFERFYQADNSSTRRGEGTGIGLALTQELVKLLGGEIAVQSEEGKGAVFSVQLPLSRKAPVAELQTENLPPAAPLLQHAGEPQPGMPAHGELPLALIVEDNADVATYLRSCLQSRYHIEVAANGREGIEKAIELVPDVIVSDVMMPEVDGFELCRTLKEDRRSSHIPIVLLTALGDMPHRLEGLETGADAYLVKPFDEQELELSLRKSMELRRRLQERYAQGAIPEGRPESVFSRDDAFVTALNELLEQKYADENFNVELMAKGMIVSQRQLLRKVDALFGASPSEQLRRFRLKKARIMLLNTDMSVTDICYATGFKDPAHFSNLFLDEYNVRPSELRRG